MKLHKIDCSAYGPDEGATISEVLAGNRIVKITPTKDGKFDVIEMCDEIFVATLTAEQLKEWGRELVALSKVNVEDTREAKQPKERKGNQ